MMPFYIGIAGMCLLLIAFVLNILKVITPDDLKYIFLNLIGSGMMVYYAYTIKGIPFLILNSVWCAASIYDLIRINVKK